MISGYACTLARLTQEPVSPVAARVCEHSEQEGKGATGILFWLSHCLMRFRLARARQRGPVKAENSHVGQRMTLSYEPYRFPGEPDKLCESYLFDSLSTFLYVDFFRGLRLKYIPKRRDNCGRYFLIAAGKYNNYCERVLEDDPDRTCRDIGAQEI